jgi:hypothetical protein
MAAGLGFKDFTTGEVLTAADVDGYLMQGIWVFASTAARDAAVTAPAEGNFAFTKDTNSLWYYDGAVWVASGATGDIEGVTAGIGISGGGTSGTVTVTNSMATAIDAKGDLIGGTGADTFARLAVGANDTVLTADSTAATGLKWAAAAAGGGDVVKVASGSFSAASTVSVDNCFSSSYDYYKIFFDLSSGTTSNFDIRLRVGGVDNSTSNYNYQFFYGAGTTNTAGRDSSQTGIRVGTTFSGGEINYSEITVFNPFKAEITGFITQCASRNLSAASACEAQIFNGSHCVASSFDGFTILNGGSKTGKYRVYGYKN